MPLNPAESVHPHAPAFLPDDAIDPALRDPPHSSRTPANRPGQQHQQPSARFAPSLVPAHFPKDEPHGQLDLEAHSNTTTAHISRHALRPRFANAQHATANDPDSDAGTTSRAKPAPPQPSHRFNRSLYPGYDDQGRRRGLDHLHGTQSAGHGDYYRPNTHEYTSVPPPQSLQHEHQPDPDPAPAGGDHFHPTYRQHHDQRPPLSESDLALMLQSQSAEGSFQAAPAPAPTVTLHRERTLHELFGLQPGAPISLAALKDPPEGQKPDYTYPTLMKVAIWSSPRRMLTLQEIYDALERRFPYFKTCKNPNSWKTSIRHSLSLIAIFQKKPRPTTDPGKGSYWTLDLTKGEGNKRQRKRNKKPPKSKAKPKPSSAASGDADSREASVEQQPNTSLDDDDADMSATDEDDVCIDPALIHQPTPMHVRARAPETVAAYESDSIASRMLREGLGLGQRGAAARRARGAAHAPYPQRSHSRLHDFEGESENDSATNSSSWGRSATSTPFDDDSACGRNANGNGNGARANGSAPPSRPAGRQMSAVPGYLDARIPVSLNEFHLGYAAAATSSDTGLNNNHPLARPVPRRPTRIPHHSHSPSPPVVQQQQQQQQQRNSSAPAPGSVPASRSSSSHAAPRRGPSGFAAHAARNVSFSSAAAAASVASESPFGRAGDDNTEIEIVQVGGGLPVARRVSNARAMGSRRVLG